MELMHIILSLTEILTVPGHAGLQTRSGEAEVERSSKCVLKLSTKHRKRVRMHAVSILNTKPMMEKLLRCQSH